MALTKAQLIDLNANELIIDLDADTSITADTDDQIDIKIAGADDFRFTANTFTALSGSTIAAQALTATTLTTTGAIAIANDGNIGSAGDADAIAISSSGVVTFSQTPVLSGASLTAGTTPLTTLDIDGATDIGAAVADADLFIIDDGAGGTNRKVTAARVKTYMGAEGGAFSLDNLDIDGATDIGAAIVDADLFIIDDGAGGTNRKVAASRIKTYAGGLDGVTTGSGNVTITDGDLIFGGAGHGVYLGVTSATAANHLDDYEEGTVDWYTLTDGTATWTQNQANYRYAAYTKIGNQVHVHGNIYNGSLSGTQGGPLRVPLPFAAANVGPGQNRAVGHAAVYNGSSAYTGDYTILKLEAGGSYGTVVSAGNGGAWGTVTFPAGGTIIIDITYTAA